MAYIRLKISWVLFRIGLADDWEEDLSLNDIYPNIPPTPTSHRRFCPPSDLIKSKLAVVEYEEKDEESDCVVCLNSLERGQKVRELCNCKHVFHRVCLDKWVDLGQTTCPLCRSSLLPAITGERKDSWLVDRISYLFGEDLGIEGYLEA
ncbi:hypothetical protein AMTR_s00001p00271850 [Amborella trichopoda]|uniref:RING-type domain-containing protein n=2 Tax=Amborella trichopoda TaxID=13333 RepID=W1NLB5_AMBTC|nr:hypothetical protein AMTR_s00001p00271850 [Amborella trichopoda]